MLCAAARAAPARCPRTGATPGRAAGAINTGRRCATIQPRAASSFDRELGGSSSAPSDFGPDVRLAQTISDIDALLGIDVEAARAEAAAAATAAAPASGSAAAEPAVPAEWAHLPAEELVRRQKLVSLVFTCCEVDHQCVTWREGALKRTVEEALNRACVCLPAPRSLSPPSRASHLIPSPCLPCPPPGAAARHAGGSPGGADCSHGPA